MIRAADLPVQDIRMSERTQVDEKASDEDWLRFFAMRMWKWEISQDEAREIAAKLTAFRAFAGMIGPLGPVPPGSPALPVRLSDYDRS